MENGQLHELKLINMNKRNVVLEKSLHFALQIIRLTRTLSRDVASSVIGKQLVRSGTSIGANVTEAQDASSLKDFTQKMAIALREAKESKYWLYLLSKSELVPQAIVSPLYTEVDEISAILSKIVKSSKQ